MRGTVSSILQLSPTQPLHLVLVWLEIVRHTRFRLCESQRTARELGFLVRVVALVRRGFPPHAPDREEQGRDDQDRRCHADADAGFRARTQTGGCGRGAGGWVCRRRGRRCLRHRRGGRALRRRCAGAAGARSRSRLKGGGRRRVASDPEDLPAQRVVVVAVLGQLEKAVGGILADGEVGGLDGAKFIRAAGQDRVALGVEILRLRAGGAPEAEEGEVERGPYRAVLHVEGVEHINHLIVVLIGEVAASWVNEFCCHVVWCIAKGPKGMGEGWIIPRGLTSPAAGERTARCCASKSRERAPGQTGRLHCETA